MFKLLTEEKTVEVKREYLLRREVVILALFSFALLIGLVGLFPAFIISNAREQEAIDRAATVKQSPVSDESKALRSQIVYTNNKLKLLSPDTDTDKPYEWFLKLALQKTADVTFSGLTWTKSNTGVKLTLTGTAADRGALLTLQNRLNASPDFSGATLPVSNLSQDKDIKFEFTLTPQPR